MLHSPRSLFTCRRSRETTFQVYIGHDKIVKAVGNIVTRELLSEDR